MIIFLIQNSTSFIHAINLKEYSDQIVSARDQLIVAIKSLKDGKLEISKIYSDQLKPQLIDTLDSKINDTKKITDGLQDAISPLTNIPGFIKKLVDIGDLEPTLQWIIDNPLAKVNGVLTDTKNIFQPITEKLIPPSDADMAANAQKIAAIYAQADTLENPQDQDAKRKEADDIVATLDRQKQAGVLYAKFDLSTSKLQSAVCKIEKTLKAIKATFTPSPECAPK